MDKWTKKYLKIAKVLAEDNTACMSRKLGGVLLTQDNIPITFGYNGAAKGIPHADSPQWLELLHHYLLTKEEKSRFKDCYDFQIQCKGKCPRRLLDIPSGERLELCPCSHLERNLIYHAAYCGHSTKNSVMYIYSPLPCHECCIACIQAGVKKVYYIKASKDYSPTSRWMFDKTKIEIEEVDEREIKL